MLRGLKNKMKLLMFVIMFFLIGAFFIISENNLALKNPEARAEFGRIYLLWIGQVFGNSGNLIGYITRLEWLPNETEK